MSQKLHQCLGSIQTLLYLKQAAVLLAPFLLSIVMAESTCFQYQPSVAIFSSWYNAERLELGCKCPPVQTEVLSGRQSRSRVTSSLRSAPRSGFTLSFGQLITGANF